MACGAIGRWEEIREYVPITSVTQPNARRAAAYDSLYSIYRSTYVALRPAFAALAATPAASVKEDSDHTGGGFA